MLKAKIPLKRQLSRGLTLVLLLSATLFLLGGWLLLLKPSLDNVAGNQIDRIATRLQTHLLRMEDDSRRLLHLAADWLTEGDLTLDHRSLNRRFMPLLKQYPDYASLRVADPTGNEWMLFRRSDGTWLNRLTKGAESVPTRRFLSWSEDGELQRDERLESDYSPTLRPWYRLTRDARLGQPVWSEIHRFDTSLDPGITTAMRIRVGDDSELLLALDLRLETVAGHLSPRQPGEAAHTVLITEEGRLLGSAGLPAVGDDLPTLQPVLGLDIQPLKLAVKLWLERDGKAPAARLRLHDGELWHLGFRRLVLGERSLWLGTLLPVTEIMPGIHLQLIALGFLLLLTLSAGRLLGRLLARDLSRPLEQLAADCRRIGQLDLAPTPILPNGPREIRELAEAQEAMRARLADAFDQLPNQSRSPAEQSELIGIEK